MSFSSVFLAVASSWNSGKGDKNGLAPILLKCVAGKAVNKSIISGTIAESLGIKENHTYMISVTEGEVDETYGRQFNFTNLGEVSGVAILDAYARLGNSVIVDVTASVEVEDEDEKEDEDPIKMVFEAPKTTKKK